MFFLHVRIGVWVDLGDGGTPEIDLPGSRDGAPTNVCPDLATGPFGKLSPVSFHP